MLSPFPTDANKRAAVWEYFAFDTKKFQCLHGFEMSSGEQPNGHLHCPLKFVEGCTQSPCGAFISKGERNTILTNQLMLLESGIVSLFYCTKHNIPAIKIGRRGASMIISCCAYICNAGTNLKKAEVSIGVYLGGSKKSPPFYMIPANIVCDIAGGFGTPDQAVSFWLKTGESLSKSLAKNVIDGKMADSTAKKLEAIKAIRLTSGSISTTEILDDIVIKAKSVIDQQLTEFAARSEVAIKNIKSKNKGTPKKDNLKKIAISPDMIKKAPKPILAVKPKKTVAAVNVKDFLDLEAKVSNEEEEEEGEEEEEISMETRAKTDTESDEEIEFDPDNCL